MKELLNSFTTLIKTLHKDKVAGVLGIAIIMLFFTGKLALQYLDKYDQAQQEIKQLKNECSEAVIRLQGKYEERLREELVGMREKERRVDSLYRELLTRNAVQYTNHQ